MRLQDFRVEALGASRVEVLGFLTGSSERCAVMIVPSCVVGLRVYGFGLRFRV